MRRFPEITAPIRKNGKGCNTKGSETFPWIQIESQRVQPVNSAARQHEIPLDGFLISGSTIRRVIFFSNIREASSSTSGAFFIPCRPVVGRSLPRDAQEQKELPLLHPGTTSAGRNTMSRIHGTVQNASIRPATSAGCIRLLNGRALRSPTPERPMGQSVLQVRGHETGVSRPGAAPAGRFPNARLPPERRRFPDPCRHINNISFIIRFAGVGAK